MVFPVVTVRQPAVLKGQANGRLDPEIIVAVPGQQGGPTVHLIEPAARGWRALCAAALRAGHVLKSVSSYRTYDEQLAIWNARMTLTPLPGRPSRTWNGRTWWLKPGMAAVAPPGHSNHGLAITVDAGEETDGDPTPESLDDPTLAWLLAHEQDFGFSHEIQSERWHIRYFAGDQIPAAVLAYERALTPTPAPPQEGDDMFTYEYDTNPAVAGGDILVLVAGGKQVRITNGEIAKRRAQAIETHLGKVDKTEYDAFAKAYGPLVNPST